AIFWRYSNPALPAPSRILAALSRVEASPESSTRARNDFERSGRPNRASSASSIGKFRLSRECRTTAWSAGANGKNPRRIPMFPIRAFTSLSPIGNIGILRGFLPFEDPDVPDPRLHLSQPDRPHRADAEGEG